MNRKDGTDHEMLQNKKEALTKIRTILNRMPDEEGPLTLEQLREKDGKPVWIVEYPDWGHWELSEDANDYITDRDPELYGLTYPDPEGKEGLHKLGWVAYDYPIANEWKQGRIDRVAWSECVCNTKEKACCTCISLRCQFCIRESEYKRGSYCSACGHPLTKEAWEKLEKRLTGDLLKYKEAVERMGDFGKLFVSYAGDPRGPMGRAGDWDIAKAALSQPVITDVDGGKWRPVNEDVMQELIRQLDWWKEQNFRACQEKGDLEKRAETAEKEVEWKDMVIKAAEDRAIKAEARIERMKSLMQAEGIAVISGDCPEDKSKWNL